MYYKSNIYIVLKANLLYILLFLNIFCFQTSGAQEPNKKGNLNQPVKVKAPVSAQKNRIKSKGIAKIKTDTIPTDSIKKPKEVIDYKVIHNAEDYTIQNAKNKTITLYNKAHVVYGDIDLKAGKIIVNYKKNTVYATGIKDSTGTKYLQRPIFKQGSQESEQDSILFNFKTKKALVYGVKTVQGEMITYGEKTKRINDSTVYMRKLKFTTSKKKNPDYYIATNKAKLVPGKKIIVGGSQLYIADVPTPLYLPFAYFPLTKERASGFIIPSWGENNQQGFFLQNGGYYFAVNDYLDLQVTGDVYSNGSWAMSADSNYYVRYKYSGSLQVSYYNNINSIRGFKDYSKSSRYNIRWSHGQDTKLSPNSQLRAYVDLGSSTFYNDSYNVVHQSQNQRNTLSSSINYSRNFVGTPFRMNASIRHNQNSNTKKINMTLPSLNISMDRIYPFAGKGGVKKNALQRIGVNYNLNSKYEIETTDDDFFTSKMFKKAKADASHDVSASTNIKVFKYFTLTPQASYNDYWYFEKIKKRFDPNRINRRDKTLGAVVNDTISGFTRFNRYSFGTGLTTKLYGIFNFKKGRIKAIRHTFSPSISWNYTPKLDDHHNLQVQQSNDPNDLLTYSPFIYGRPNSVLSNSIGISIGNVLEAKVTPKDSEEKDDEEEDKRVTLLNNLSFNSSYNIAADSMRWSRVSFSAGIPIISNKLNLNISGNFNPYQVTDKGVPIDKFNKYILRLENISLNTNYSISSEELKKGKKKKPDNKKNNNNPPDILGTEINPINKSLRQRNVGQRKGENQRKETKLYHANIPWDISLGYSISYTENGYNLAEVSHHTLDFSGNIELSPKWKVGFRSGYDLKNGAFASTSFNFARDLDSWRLNFNWVPFGDYTSYYFFIGVKSSMLSDLKWDKQKPPDRRLF